MINMQTELCGWVWHPDVKTDNAYVDFLADIPAIPKAEKIVLRISADSNYAAWWNGRFVSSTQYADYPEYKVYDEIDITPYSRDSANRLCIRGYHQGEDSHVYRRGLPGVWFLILCDGTPLACSNGNVLCRPSPDYVSGEMERITGQLSFSFRYDATKRDEWQQPHFLPGADWVQAAVRENTLPLHSRPISKLSIGARETMRIQTQGTFRDEVPFVEGMGNRMQRAALRFKPLKEMTGVSPIAVLPQRDGIRFADSSDDGLFILLDMQQESAGFLELDLDLPEEADILIGYGEHLDDLRVRTAVGGRQFTVRYRGKKGRQTFMHRFKRFGCRYLQLHIYTQDVTLYYAGIRSTHYPFEDKGQFRCSDHLHNQIYRVCLHTLKLSAHEHYEDCPWREQALYAMDSRNQMLCGYYAFGEFAMPKASLKLLALGQRESGMLEMCAPSRISITIPAFSLCFVTNVYEYALHSGDLEYVRELLPCLQRILKLFCDRIAENGLVPCFTEPEYWNFYEWSDGLDGGEIMRQQAIEETYDAPLNGFLAIALLHYSRLCHLLGLTDEADKAQQLHAQLKKAINRLFWDEERQLYSSFIKNGVRQHYAELTQSLLVCGDVPDSSMRNNILHQLAYPDGTLVPVTLSCTLYKYEALMQEPDTYGRLMFQQIADVWGKMLFAGATTMWETEKGAWDFGNAGSLCHGWSAVPVYFYYAYALGIRPNQQERHPIDSGLYELSGNTCIPLT